MAAAGAGAAEAGADEAQGPEDRARAMISQVRDLAPRARWSPETDGALLPLSSGGRRRPDVASAVADLASGDALQLAPLEDLCATLRGGGYEVAELCCEAGGVERTLALLTAPQGQLEGGTWASARRLAAEALWLMIYDDDACSRVIQAGGHGQVIKLLREEGPRDALLSGGALRVLGETLYSEGRKADLWADTNLDLLVEALDWALTAEPADRRGPLLATVCNIAALWVWRARDAAVYAVLPLVGLMPRLLRELRNWGDNPDVMFNCHRLLHALSTRCRYWPENVREPVLAAMRALVQLQQADSLEEGSAAAREASAKVLEAVEKLPTAPPAGCLSMMD